MGADKPAQPAEPPALPRSEVLDSLQLLARILRVLEGNADELAAWLRRTEDPAVLLAVWNADDPGALDRHLDETERRLFNFLASVHARVDHYRTVKKRGHLTGELADEYELRRQKVAASGLHQWMIGMRNFLLHDWIPATMGQFRFDAAGGGQSTSHVVIRTKELVGNDYFKSDAQKLMNGTEEIDLLEAVTEYVSLIHGFDAWFGRAYLEHHLNDL